MRFARLALVPLFLVLSWSASAYENPELAADAAVYFRQIIAKHGGRRSAKAAQAALAQAEGFQKARNWERAITAYERTIALGRREPDIWFRLSNSWASKRPADLKRALAAAYYGFSISKAPDDKALGLWHIAARYEGQQDYKKAVDAYEASLALNDNARVKQAYNRIVGRVKLVVSRIRTEAESDTPRICVEFSKPLDKRQALRMGDYVRIEPQVEMSVSARGSTLCIEGVAHGTTYQLTVLQGLPGEDALTVEKSEHFNVVVPNREPSIAFKGRAFILPTKGRQGLPFTSVNVKRAKLEILRVSDRAVVQMIKDRKITRLLSGYDVREIKASDGEPVWSGEIDIEAKSNKEVTTTIPVNEVLKARKPGIYVAVATPADAKTRSWSSRATQWFVVTDLGLTTMMGPDGLHVSVRSLASAEPRQDVNVLLVARNNDEIARMRTGANGIANFAPGAVRGAGGARPAAVMAFAKGGEFVFLDLTRPAFDLTDRGVGGRSVPGPVDAFLYTERGVYRPGERVHATVLLRNDGGKALEKLPLVLRVIRPDGMEARRIRLAASGNAGGRAVTIALPKTARTGRWTLAAHVDPKAKPVGTVRFQVEDFVPERMTVKLAPASPDIRPGIETKVGVDAQFLYGAPAADLLTQGELVLAMNMRPYEKYEGYIFGLVQEEFTARRIALKDVRTDAKGKAAFAIKLDKLPDTTRPLEARVRVSVVEPGGRATTRAVTLPVRAGALVLGIKPEFEGAVQTGAQANFSVVALKPDGTPTSAAGLDYELVREEYRYHWYYRGGNWRYRVTIEETDSRKGKLDVGTSPAALAFKLEWGAYRLELRDKNTGAASSVRFHVGWWSAVAADDTPDKLRVTLDKKKYAAGETAKVFIKPPFDGKVQLVVASDKIQLVRNLDVSAAGTTIELPVDAKWGPSTYVLATAFRPATAGGADGRPARAVGLAHITTDMSARTLSVKIEAPAKMTPRQKVVIPITVTGAANRSHAYVTLAAVDEGILQLTGFKSPKPGQYYFGKRLLAFELRDDYGRLIDPGKAAFGEVRQGGDAQANRHLGGLDASSIKTVALFSGIVALDAQGRAKITLDVPDFNGRLRLMAVAWTADKVGAAESAMIVRDALVSTVTLPRFLAPRDVARMTVSLHNVDGPAGDYKVAVAGTLAKPVGGPATRTYKLAKDGHIVAAYRLSAPGVGVGKVSLTIEGPGGYRIERRWDLAVRPAQTVLTRRFVKRIQPGATVRYDRSMLRGFVPGTAEVTMSFSTVPDLDLAGLLKQISQYPYGCAEQTTSKALPLLYVAEIAGALGIAEDFTRLRAQVQGAVGRIMTMQSGDGSFGLWSATSSHEEWLTAYVMDFLTQAKKAKYPVPSFGYERGLEWLQGRVASADFQTYQLPARAYAFYVLAQAGKARLSDLRYFSDTYLKRMPTALAMAQTAAALALTGDGLRAAHAFDAAFRFKERPRNLWRNWTYWDYGSDLRDRSALVYLAAATNNAEARIPAAVEDLTRLLKDDRYTSTQEKAWLLLAAHELIGSAKSMTLDLDGKPMTRAKPLYLLRTAASLRSPLTARNTGKDALWHSATVSGVPVKPQPRESRGFVIKRAFYTLDGKRADVSKVRQGEVLVAVINGEAITGRRHQALVVDLLPAGFEIENARLEGGRDNKEMSWLPKLTSTIHEEPRDDRYVAALNLGGGSTKQAFTLAYLVRAVTPGNFTLPAAYVEDMYSPNYFGRDASARVTILPLK